MSLNALWDYLFSKGKYKILIYAVNRLFILTSQIDRNPKAEQTNSNMSHSSAIQKEPVCTVEIKKGFNLMQSCSFVITVCVNTNTSLFFLCLRWNNTQFFVTSPLIQNWVSKNIWLMTVDILFSSLLFTFSWNVPPACQWGGPGVCCWVCKPMWERASQRPWSGNIMRGRPLFRWDS